MGSLWIRRAPRRDELTSRTGRSEIDLLEIDTRSGHCVLTTFASVKEVIERPVPLRLLIIEQAPQGLTFYLGRVGDIIVQRTKDATPYPSEGG